MFSKSIFYAFFCILINLIWVLRENGTCNCLI